MPHPRLLQPLTNRQFRRLWLASSISMLGDGFYYVAIAWAAIGLGQGATGLSAVWLAFTLPHLLALLGGSALLDRFPRRTALLAAVATSGGAIAAIASLALLHGLTLWNLCLLVACYGASEACYGPVFGAIIPDLVSSETLAEANSLNQLSRPMALRILGPILGGVVVAGAGVGAAFAVDAASFVIAGVLIAGLPQQPAPRLEQGKASLLAEARQGLACVRSQGWLWAGICASAIGTVATWGAVQTLVPLIVHDILHDSARQFSYILLAGGVGSIVAALAVGQRGLPARPVAALFISFVLKAVAVAGFGLVAGLGPALVIAFVVQGLTTYGLVIWNTLLHQRVERSALGRVNSLDWLLSTSLMPLTLLFLGPLANAFGPQRLLVAFGLGAAALSAVCYLPRSVRRDEDTPDVASPALAD